MCLFIRLHFSWHLFLLASFLHRLLDMWRRLKGSQSFLGKSLPRTPSKYSANLQLPALFVESI